MASDLLDASFHAFADNSNRSGTKWEAVVSLPAVFVVPRKNCEESTRTIRADDVISSFMLLRSSGLKRISPK